MSDLVRFNLNDSVLFRLRDRGRKILRDRHEELRKLYPNIGEYKDPPVDKEGRCKDQLWTLMSAFGPDISLGFDPPIETTIYLEIKDPR